VVKCLVPFHPDDDADNRLENEAQVKALYDAVQASGHELLIEIVPPKHLPREPDILLRAMKRLYNLGIYPEWWTAAAAAASGPRSTH
jgi:5-dehydro-2-deoxygluconokinase